MIALTPATATAYVRATVANWGDEWTQAEIEPAWMDHEDGMAIAIVPTSLGCWTVWVERDGSLYGEV